MLEHHEQVNSFGCAISYPLSKLKPQQVALGVGCWGVCTERNACSTCKCRFLYQRIALYVIAKATPAIANHTAHRPYTWMRSRLVTSC